MKRIIFLFLGLMASAIIFAQQPQQISDDFQIKKSSPRYYFNSNWLGTTGNTGSTLLWNGVEVGEGNLSTSDTATMLTPYITTIETRDEIADSLNALRAAAIVGSTLYVKLLPDTTANVTDAYTLILTDAGNTIPCTKATSVSLTVPPNSDVAFPIRTTINFIQGGAGVIVFKEGAGVHIESLKDSVATDGINAWAALYKRGTNHWQLYGNLQQ